MLGIFDSGLGGFSVLRPLRVLLPAHDILYFADQAHVPYGDRTPDELATFLRANLDFLNEAGAEAIVVACNTSSAIAAQRGWPESAAPIVDLISSAAQAVAASGARRIGVLATTATARSGAYGAAIRKLAADAHVEELGAPALVPLVEAGALAGRGTRAAVAEACAPFSRDLEALVYGCSHYPALDVHFAEVLGASVSRIDPAPIHAEVAARLVADRQIAGGRGHTRFVTSGDPLALIRSIRAMLGETSPHVDSLVEALGDARDDVLTKSGNL
ncbi:MAG: glutamate racemase [Candidatus Eremiobacteraeota bacterium]|nr:glutamate racemase [Candidatus Eremiobacteraeota bacterium]MBV8354112.1 glutamate racemase [Candidatus Eremiobacteraeota bacterium]